MPDQAWALIATPMLALHVALHWLVVAGYCWLFITLIRSGMYWRVLFFTTWVGVMAVYLAIWKPYDFTLLRACQPILLALRICVLIEAFVLATSRISPRERRWVLVVMLAIAGAGMWISRGNYAGDQPLMWYRALNQHAHLGIALAALFGALLIFTEPPPIEREIRNHGLILILFSLGQASVNFVHGRAMGERMILTRCLFWIFTLLCIWLWCRWGMTAHFKPPQSILQSIVNAMAFFLVVFKRSNPLRVMSVGQIKKP